MKYSTIAAALTTAALLLSAGCSSTPAGTSTGGKTIVYAIESSQAKYGGLPEKIAAWEAKTGNKIKLEPIADNYESVVSARLAGGSGVDIFAGAYDKFDPAATMLEIDPSSFKNRLTPASLATLTFTDGKVYAYPKPDPMYTFGVFYNKDVFAAAGVTTPPATLTEMDAAMAKIKAAGKTPMYMAGKDGWTLLQHRNAVYYTLTQEDPQVWDKLNTNKIKFTDLKNFTTQYDSMADWAKKGYINSDFLTATYEGSEKAITDGDAAMFIQGSWVLGEMAKMKPEAKVGFFPLPTQNGKPQIGVSAQGGGNHIAKTSKVAKEAADFLQYLIEPAQVTSFMETLPGIPAFNDASLPNNAPPALKTVAEYIEKKQSTEDGDNRYRVPAPEQDQIALYQEMLAGRITAAEFSAKFTDACIKNGLAQGLPGF